MKDPFKPRDNLFLPSFHAHIYVKSNYLTCGFLQIMGRAIKKLNNLPSLKIGLNSSTDCRVLDIDEDHQYTSLKDLILSSPTRADINQEGHDFGSSTITIRNHLVKRAASAYLQSAVVLDLESQNQNYFVRLGEKIRDKATLFSRWRLYILGPICACFRPILRRLIAYLHGREVQE